MPGWMEKASRESRDRTHIYSYRESELHAPARRVLTLALRFFSEPNQREKTFNTETHAYTNLSTQLLKKDFIPFLLSNS